MKINKLTASFGKLENETLELHEGLNIIYAPNESGKSTWCAFINAMLYGVDTSQRARQGFLPDKLRYAPWSGAPMEGTMELTADRCDITVTRRTKSKGAPMRDFSAVYTGTNVPVKGMTADNAGELLTGVSKDVFRRSAFIAQGSLDVSGSPELEKRISAIVSSGEEQTSFSEADERLSAWQRKRRYNRRGLLPELEGKMDETQRRLEEMDGSLQSVEELEYRLEQTRMECDALELRVTEARKQQRREALDRLSRGRSTLKKASEEHDALMDKLSTRRDELRNSVFGLKDPEEVEKTVGADLEELAELKARSKEKTSPLLAIIMMLLSVAAAALYTAKKLPVFIIAAGIICVFAVILLMRVARQRRDRNEASEKRRTILKHYGVTGSSEIRSALAEHKRLWEEMLEAEREEQRLRAAFEDARAAQAELEETALQELDFSGGNSEAARLSRELSVKRTEAEKLSQKIASINGRLAAMGDPLVLSSSLSCMKEEYEQICGEYEALCMASDVLQEADTEIQSRFSPELGRVAARYMSAVTGGRYADVLINRDFSAKTRVSDDSVAREAEYLSAGTLDIMYLAVRLAVCELAMPDGEPCPLVIDDALVNLDEERLSQAMELLRAIARERQVILFSCRK